MDIGEKIKKIRLARGMTQSELAGDEITRNMLSRIENGSALPSLPTLLHLSEGLGVPAGLLLDDESESYCKKLEKLPEIKRAYGAGDWTICRDLCREIDDKDDEAEYISFLCIYNEAKEKFEKGKLVESAALFDELCRGDIKILYPTRHVAAQAEVYLAYISEIAPSVGNSSGTSERLPPESFGEEFCRYRALIGALVRGELDEGSSLDPTVGVLRSGGAYSAHVRGKLLMRKKRYAEARQIFCDVLASEDETPLPMMYEFFSELEICCREMLDYRGAYEYSGSKMEMIERLLR